MTTTTHNQVEQVGPDDYEEIVEVWEASVRATHDFLTEEDIQYFRPLIRNEYLQAVDLYCIRNEQGRIEGFLGTADYKVEMLFLRPETRGKGIGKALLLYAIHNLSITKVDVNEQNRQAVGFYEHMGFRVVGRSELDGTGKPYPILYMGL
ncbi:GNAT family N-acetyltransferase [Telluribacter humicola]|uniref:GNAT family N-acetyltransferase n=1 Tax=Telluribacter humicola TaxID=1720261 RepID=UPI001A9678DF|nr:GNAT family N-acetyltransferase [Telluribacter humicola]